MKNPMTPEEMKQAIDDNAAGHDMQRRITKSAAPWSDRHPDRVGEPLDFSTQEYRRKPRTSEDILQRAVDWWLENGMQKFIGAPAWVFDARALLEPEEKNPWRPIIKSEWPECKPTDKIILHWGNGATEEYIAGQVSWCSTAAIEWKYAEDE